MSEPRERRFPIRQFAYIVLAIAAAFATSSPDVMTMFIYWLAALALFEAGYFVYRRTGGGG